MPFKSPVVLLVDGQQRSAAMNAIGLLAMGFQPVMSRSTDDAFERACKIRPDVVVADMTTPGICGADLTRRLRGDRRTEETAIIVLTGQVLPADRQEAWDAGCDRFILKPCLPDRLALEIRDLLHGRRSRTVA